MQRDSARTVLCALTVFVQTIYPSHALLVAVVLCGCCGDQDSAGGRRRACGRACARVSSASRAFHARPGRAHARPRQGLDIGTGARPPQHEPPHLVDLAVVDKLLDEELAFILRKGIWEKGHAVVGVDRRGDAARDLGATTKGSDAERGRRRWAGRWRDSNKSRAWRGVDRDTSSTRLYFKSSLVVPVIISVTCSTLIAPSLQVPHPRERR